ncbi:MAG: CPBP family glutamic-type intramembrane protease [Planctomycetota bacterium]
MAEGARPIPQGYLEQSRDPLNSLVLCLPILLVYELGLFVSRGDTLNGVDFITVFLLRHWGTEGLLAFNAGLLLTCLIAVAALRRGQRLHPQIVFPILLESAAYALLMGSVIVLVMQRVLHLAAAPPPPPSLSHRVFISLGAGFHEELVFRVGIFGGVLWSLRRLLPGGNKAAAFVVALVVSSTLFSLAHYAGAEQFQLRSFVFRLLAGALLCGLFATRGFAVAVYTHTLYDIWVLILPDLMRRGG